MAEALGSNFVFSRKTNPTLISTEQFNEEAIRDDIRKTLSAARSCRLEIIMKDVHTLNNDPERLPATSAYRIDAGIWMPGILPGTASGYGTPVSWPSIAAMETDSIPEWKVSTISTTCSMPTDTSA
jgi:hypothetical protein